MLCSECSTTIRPIIAVDIDGTLSHYHAPIEKFACDYWNVPYPLTTWGGLGNHEDHMGLTQAQYREAKLAYRQGGYKRVAPLYDMALMFMIEIMSLEAEIWITTTRPWSRLDNVDPDTKFWLRRHEIAYHHLLFDDNKYKKLSEIVDPERVVLVIDDLPDVLDEAVEYLPHALHVLVERPHNYDTRGAHVVEGNFSRIATWAGKIVNDFYNKEQS